MNTPPTKSNLISCEPMVHVSDIKLIRTDTTLDLSQKAEKVQERTADKNCDPHLSRANVTVPRDSTNSSKSGLLTQLLSTVVDLLPQKINLISCEPMAHVSDIKLIRTDTTLDLSQKAEKGMNDIKLIRTDTTLDLSQKAEKVTFFIVFEIQNLNTVSNFITIKLNRGLSGYKSERLTITRTSLGMFNGNS
ncbi:hypothetical protein VNO77_33142 [Canavalia gladiata]|uniref:Uncharacterized protein n=1 Tax=Canavalia gladiata TaxID=3824 RepID=A0AAN9PW43_CANGL